MNPSPDITSMLGSLLSDPQMLSKVIGMASTLKESGLFDALSGKGDDSDNEKDYLKEDEISGDEAYGESNSSSESIDRDSGNNGDSNSEEGSKRSGTQGGFFDRNSTERNRIALISALKPYLSQEKCEKAEMLLTILGILGSVSAFRKRN